MTHIAFAAGYRNVRRFNAAVRESFDSTPTEIRKRALDPIVSPRGIFAGEPQNKFDNLFFTRGRPADLRRLLKSHF